MRKFSTVLLAMVQPCIAFESIIRPTFPVMDKTMSLNAPDFNWINHEVHTEDGYILNLFRLVPAGVSRAADCTDCKFGEPVFLLHGMGANGSRWLDRTNLDIDPLPVALAN